MPSLQPRNLIWFGIGVGRRYSQRALCFCFEWSRVFLQSVNMPHLHHRKIVYFYRRSHLCGKKSNGQAWSPLLLRLSKGIYSECHHANPTQKFDFFLDLSLLWERDWCSQGASCFGLELARVFLQGATMKPPHPRIFLDLSLLWEGDRYSRGHYASSTYLGYFWMPPCPPNTHEKSKLFWIRRKR